MTTQQLTGLADAVSLAVLELTEDGHDIELEPLGDGGAIVTIHEFCFGERWSPKQDVLRFQIAFNYPHAPIYPYYTTPTLVRADGIERPTALQIVSWRGTQCTQISLRAKRWSPTADTAAVAVAQVARWFAEVA